MPHHVLKMVLARLTMLLSLAGVIQTPSLWTVSLYTVDHRTLNAGIPRDPSYKPLLDSFSFLPYFSAASSPFFTSFHP